MHFDKRIMIRAVKSYLRNEVMPMSTYEIISTVLTVILIVVTMDKKK